MHTPAYTDAAGGLRSDSAIAEHATIQETPTGGIMRTIQGALNKLGRGAHARTQCCTQLGWLPETARIDEKGNEEKDEKNKENEKKGG